jgi:tetratricopeptide (TPR) repeat protein
MDQGEYGKALHLFMQALEQKRIYPEAELAIGDIFKAQGEIPIAEKQYLKAYDQKDNFEVPDCKYIALYRLVRLYKEQEEYLKWEQTLFKVLKEDKAYYSDRFGRLYDTFLRVYTERGLNRLLVLYRLEEKHTIYAHGELGEHYNREYVQSRDKTKRGELAESAMVHYLFAVVTLLSEVIEELRFWDPEYRFTDLPSLLRSTARREALYDYLIQTDIFKYLYYLGVATYAAGYEERASDIWSILKDEQQAGRYRNLAREQLTDPRVSPLYYID